MNAAHESAGAENGQQRRWVINDDDLPRAYADEYAQRLAAEDALATLRARIAAIAHTAANARIEDAAGAVAMAAIADLLERALEAGK